MPIDQEYRPKILIVDDQNEQIELLRALLSSKYQILSTTTGEEALKMVRDQLQPDLIILDINMPGMDGFAVCQQLKSDKKFRQIPIIFITALLDAESEQQGLELGAVDFISKPFSPSLVKARVDVHITLADKDKDLHHQVIKRQKELLLTQKHILMALGRAGEYKDNETGLHVSRMSDYTRLISESIGKSPNWTEMLYFAAPMHDIGKIGISDNILLKPGKLNEEEWTEMKRHPLIGANIIGQEKNQLLKLSRTIALGHHEKWDGSGYPYGLRAEEIPLAARIIAISDVFDALTSARPYKKAWSCEEAVNYMRYSAGSHFDPSLIAIFNHKLPAIIDCMACHAQTEPVHG